MNQQMNRQMNKQMTDKQLRVRTLVHAGEDEYASCKNMGGKDKCQCEFDVREALGWNEWANWSRYDICLMNK